MTCIAQKKDRTTLQKSFYKQAFSLRLILEDKKRLFLRGPPNIQNDKAVVSFQPNTNIEPSKTLESKSEKHPWVSEPHLYLCAKCCVPFGWIVQYEQMFTSTGSRNHCRLYQELHANVFTYAYQKNHQSRKFSQRKKLMIIKSKGCICLMFIVFDKGLVSFLFWQTQQAKKCQRSCVGICTVMSLCPNKVIGYMKLFYSINTVLIYLLISDQNVNRWKSNFRLWGKQTSVIWPKG